MQLLRSLVLTLAGAGILWYLLWTRPPGPGPVVDARLKPALIDWMEDMRDLGLDVKWRYGRLDWILVESSGHLAGHSDPGSGTLMVSEQALSRGPWTAKAVLYHELGHYIFGLNHTDEISIMYKENLPEDYYRENWPELLNDYLTQCKNNGHELKFR